MGNPNIYGFSLISKTCVMSCYGSCCSVSHVDTKQDDEWNLYHVCFSLISNDVSLLVNRKIIVPMDIMMREFTAPPQLREA